MEETLETFKDVLENGGCCNSKSGEDSIYLVGPQPGAILCKLVNGVHYSYQRDKKMWVKL